ncbi:thioesterase family protein [Gordonia humi]
MVVCVSDQQKASAAHQPFTVDVAMRWGDQDSLGHINNVQIARIVEESRVRAMTEWFGDARTEFWTVLARQELEFVSILHYSAEPVTVHVWISRIGTSSFDFGCRLVAPTGEVAALSDTTVTAVDPATQRPMPLTDFLVDRLRERLGDPVPLRRRR